MLCQPDVLKNGYFGYTHITADAALETSGKIIGFSGFLVESGFQKADQKIDLDPGRAHPDAISAIDAGVIGCQGDVPVILKQDGIGERLHGILGRENTVPGHGAADDDAVFLFKAYLVFL